MKLKLFHHAFVHSWAMLLLMITTPSNAQYYMNVRQTDGSLHRYAVNVIDSVSVNKPNEYVDLGLSVKWATFNIGATAPEEAGYIFAWGETETKSTYDWSSYKYCQGTDNSMTKYCSDSSYGTDDGMITLEPDDDVAHVIWGGNWRMPTSTEFEELINNCTWTYSFQKGVEGYIVSSNIAGYEKNSIFLPFWGFNMNTGIRYGRYWSSSLYSDNSSRGWILGISRDNYSISQGNRNIGNTVRPVLP